MKKGLKTLISIPLTFIVGGLAIIEILFEMIYQLVKLLRRGFKLFTNGFLKLIKPVYIGKWKATIKKENREVEIMTFDYELKEEGESSK